MSAPRPMDYHVRHVTTYRYAGAVTISHHAGRLIPRAFAAQKVHSAGIEISPTPSHRCQRKDFFGNTLTNFTLTEPYSTLRVTATARVSVQPPPLPEALATPSWESVASRLSSAVGADLADACQFTFNSPLITGSDALRAYGAEVFTPGRPILDGAVELCRRIHTDFTYDPTATTIATPLGQVMQDRRGVCQDFAHVMIGAMRSLGLAARYVSGYVLTQMPGTGDHLEGGDASHAWVSVFVPVAGAPNGGWIDIDPTNNKIVTHEHIVTAWGRDFDDVSPIKGVMLGGDAGTPEVSVAVTPINPDGSTMTGNNL
ncbi:transglutaminase family protein [Roseospira marina]|uniref:Transglutaminase family protein n=1 Tax=Roseospira marina TaxID=140057 RepID=A0A5M6IEP0_9PROT|nr:transglutaminase family protein [Roseospira marina]KAA5606740.1 transglutaminase family protein [Roseospira marina]MBB4313840.1 transglutaminase-like putative cysteine protease [Roseospira marina]MBB5087002.1 transglutaminase-like putative cysteine protease [Roseospira marina]